MIISFKLSVNDQLVNHVDLSIYDHLFLKGIDDNLFKAKCK